MPQEKPENTDASKRLEALTLEVGRALILCQLAEKRIELCANWVFHDPSLTYEQLTKRRNGINFLSDLIKQLRKSGVVNHQFDDLLARFKDHRDDLAHNLVRFPKADLSSATGQQKIKDFALETNKLARAVFVALQPAVEAFDTHTKEAFDRLYSSTPDDRNG